MAPAECNYKIYNKELLAIIWCFEKWRPELEGTGLPVNVLTDHKGLEYFMTTKKLTSRQVRWAEFLLEFNFVISYQSGKKNDKADALTRKPNERPHGNDKRLEHCMRTLLPPERVELQPIEESEGKELNLSKHVAKSNREDEICTEIWEYLADPKNKEQPDTFSKGLRVNDGLLLKKNLLWIPEDIWVDVIKTVHDQQAVGHPGVARTLEMIQRNYYWPKMKGTIQQYTRNCHVCKRAKAARDTYHGLLQPLPVPERPWVDVTMDFVVGLPKCHAYGQVYDAILMVIDWLSKERHYIPCSEENEGTSAAATADLFVCDVWLKHGLPTSLTSDRGSQFVSKMWDSLCKLLGIRAKLSTAHHSKTNGQSKIANQEAERHLQTYTNHFQDVWVQLLPIREFAANANVSATTKIPPFLVTKGYNPRMSFDHVDLSANFTRKRIANATARLIAGHIEKV